jgi:hypothetical protein
MRLKLPINPVLQNIGRFTTSVQHQVPGARACALSLRRRGRLKRRYRLFLLPLLCMLSAGLAQTTYDTFEGNKLVTYVDKSGVLDTLARNPAPDKTNASEHCALYIRNNSKKFDNIKMKLYANLVDVSAYTTYEGVPPKLKMKIYTTAAPGTLVEILLGSNRGNNAYPAGTNSQFQAYTTVSNQWEELEFKFSQIPEGSETSSTQVDQVTLLFNPNSNTSDKFYFDEINGPGLVSWPPDPIAVPEKTKKTGDGQKVKTSKKVTNK